MLRNEGIQAGLNVLTTFSYGGFCKKDKEYWAGITVNLLKESFKTNFPRENLQNEV